MLIHTATYTKKRQQIDKLVYSYALRWPDQRSHLLLNDFAGKAIMATVLDVRITSPEARREHTRKKIMSQARWIEIYTKSFHIPLDETHTSNHYFCCCYVIIFFCRVHRRKKIPIIYMFLSSFSIFHQNPICSECVYPKKKETRCRETRWWAHTKPHLVSSYWKYFDWKCLVDCWKCSQTYHHIGQLVLMLSVAAHSLFFRLSSTKFSPCNTTTNEMHSIFNYPLNIKAMFKSSLYNSSNGRQQQTLFDLVNKFKLKQTPLTMIKSQFVFVVVVVFFSGHIFIK